MTIMYLKIYDCGTVSYYPLPAAPGMDGMAVELRDGEVRPERITE